MRRILATISTEISTWGISFIKHKRKKWRLGGSLFVCMQFARGVWGTLHLHLFLLFIIIIVARHDLFHLLLLVAYYLCISLTIWILDKRCSSNPFRFITSFPWEQGPQQILLDVQYYEPSVVCPFRNPVWWEPFESPRSLSIWKSWMRAIWVESPRSTSAAAVILCAIFFTILNPEECEPFEEEAAQTPQEATPALWPEATVLCMYRG